MDYLLAFRRQIVGKSDSKKQWEHSTKEDGRCLYYSIEGETQELESAIQLNPFIHLLKERHSWSANENCVVAIVLSKQGSGTSHRGSSTSSVKYRCKEIGSWDKAQALLKQGHTYLDRDGDGKACELLQ